jgi:glycerophosphoryl diester phosphodiesterase
MLRRWRVLAALLAALLVAPLSGVLSPAAAFDLQGHRGTRGLAPENTLAAFERALRLGVTTLELDVMLTADGELVISHDPALNPDLTRDASGQWLPGPGPLIRALTFAQLQAYDVGRVKPGSRTARDFLQQQAVDGQRVPRLSDLFARAAALGAREVRYNIEIKRNPQEPEKYGDLPALVDAVVAAVTRAGVGPHALIQSFDWNVLQRVQQVAPQLATSYLSIQRPQMNNIEAPAWTAGFTVAAQGSVPKMVKAAGGRWWAPMFRDLTPELVREAQALGIKVVPWTVNETADMERVIDLKVDGLITDYPDRAREVMARRGLPLPAAWPAR